MKLRWDGSLPSNIIGFYGSFVRGETYNIILEYADLGNLDYFMEQTPPPSSASEKTLFWDRFFDVGNGLVKIHGEEEGNGNELQILLGYAKLMSVFSLWLTDLVGIKMYTQAISLWSVAKGDLCTTVISN